MVREEIVYQMAYYEQLTNLPNRTLFFKRMEEFIIDAKIADCIIVLLYLDFDRFKLINDIVGHDAGDQFLKEISEKIKLNFHENTIIARLGVETEQQLKVLNNYGCDEVQGYLLGKPVSLEEIEKMFDRGNFY